MNVISEKEKQQLLAAGMHDGGARRRPPGAPRLQLKNYLRQLEEYARLFSPPPHRPPVGNQWKL